MNKVYIVLLFFCLLCCGGGLGFSVARYISVGKAMDLDLDFEPAAVLRQLARLADTINWGDKDDSPEALYSLVNNGTIDPEKKTIHAAVPARFQKADDQFGRHQQIHQNTGTVHHPVLELSKRRANASFDVPSRLQRCWNRRTLFYPSVRDKFDQPTSPRLPGLLGIL